MSHVETKSGATNSVDVYGKAQRRRVNIVPVFITLATIWIAIVLGRAMWDAYMVSPWTRDSMVRAYVVTMTPEVSGRIVEMPVLDNQFVHKGDVLMVIDPTDYRIALGLAEAGVLQAEAERRRKLSDLVETVEDRETHEAIALATHAQYRQAVAQLDRAKVNLERTERRSPVNGWVTNLLAQQGDCANVGQNVISVVDADSY
jgi:multidrug resistance efflux pump